MPATYTLHASEDTSPEAAAGWLSAIPGFTRTIKGIGAADLTSVDVYREDEFSQNIVRRAFGFRPLLTVAMIPDKFDDEERGLDQIADALDAWIRTGRGDLVLLLDRERVIATHLSGRTTLNRSSSFWTPHADSVCKDLTRSTTSGGGVSTCAARQLRRHQLSAMVPLALPIPRRATRC